MLFPSTGSPCSLSIQRSSTQTKSSHCPTNQAEGQKGSNYYFTLLSPATCRVLPTAHQMIFRLAVFDVEAPAANDSAHGSDDAFRAGLRHTDLGRHGVRVVLVVDGFPHQLGCIDCARLIKFCGRTRMMPLLGLSMSAMRKSAMLTTSGRASRRMIPFPALSVL